MSESNPTSIKTTEAVRDRLRLLAADRGTTITELLSELAAEQLTATEREERAQQAIADLHRETGYRVTDTDRQTARTFLAGLHTHRGDQAA